MTSGGVNLQQSVEQPVEQPASDRFPGMIYDRVLPTQNSPDADNEVAIQSDPAVRTGAITSVTRIEDTVENFDKHGDVEERKQTVGGILNGWGKDAPLVDRVSGAVSGMFSSGQAMERSAEPALGQVQPAVHYPAGGVAPPSHHKDAPKEKRSFLKKIGIGKDDGEGRDPHPELAEHKDSFFTRVKGCAKSKTGGAEGMEKPALTMQTTELASREAVRRADAPLGFIGRLFEAMSSSVGPGNAAEHGQMKPPPANLPDDIESTSNVQKLSPFTGPSDGNAAGALDAIPAEKTSGVPASHVKAPGFMARAQEEVAAVGEVLKDVVVGKK